MLAIGILGSVRPAGAQSTTPDYQLHCSDCSGVEYFNELDAGDTNGCQNYAHNVYENWTREGTTAPDPKFVVASQTDIVRIDQASDANFWYYRIVTRAANWSSVLLKNANVELAFGDCSVATTRFALLMAYDVDPTDAGATWKAQGEAKLKFYRDASSGNNRIGDTNNDGPAAPVGNTSNYDSNDDGYETDVNVAASDAYSRLHTVGPNATMEFAIRRTSAVFTAISSPFTPCFGRAWTGQTSTIAKDQFAINDQRPSADFSSVSWAIDSCNGAAEVDPCDPAPNCTASDTACGVASCDSNGAIGNCDVLTPRAADTVCRAAAGECDLAEVCNGVDTGACPSNAFDPAATPCGSGSDSICDNPDTCDGAGNCIANNEPGSTLCRADAGDCDVAETCDGAGSCPADSFENADTPCGSSSDTVCDNPDTCDANGACQSNNEPGSTVCREDAGECDVAETCDGAGSCPIDGFAAADTPCGSSSDTICDNADSCDSGGTCQPNNEPGSTICRVDAGECDLAESCDGAGSCPDDGFEPAAAPCGSAGDTVCDNPDSCDAGGTCQPNNEPGSTICRVDAGECDLAESCDGAGSCPGDSFEPADTPCGNPSDTSCDNPDSCNATGTCVVNNEPGSTLCRADAGECDVAENCDGAGLCPVNGFEPTDTPCGSAADTICDNPDSCDASGTCQPNNESGSTLCRADAGACDIAENCDGAGSCPANGLEPTDTPCGSAGDTICDDPDSCDANGTCQPNNEPGSTLCRADSGECDTAENCDGAGSCPADSGDAPGTPCGSAGDTICDDPDTCNGNGSCDDNNESGSTLCRGAVGECDTAENCDGDGSCPGDSLDPLGTPCGSSADTVCDNADTCDGTGTCQPNNEPGSTLCRADAGECDTAENCDGAGSCPANTAESAGTPCGSDSDSICDNPDTCNGSGSCQSNNEPGSTLCRTDTGECDVAENCTAGECPADGFEPATTPCGSGANTVCDNPDTCNGLGSCQTNNEPGSTLCRADAGDCDVPESCNGAGSCPANAFEPAATPCGSSSDTLCDNPDTCNASGSCQPNLAAGGTLCRASTGECDPAEQCTGTTGSCPSNGFDPNGTPCAPDSNSCTEDECVNGVCEHEPNTGPCDDGAFCTEGDTCSGGSCAGTPINCSDGIDCTDDSCNEGSDACEHDGDDSQCDDADPCTEDNCSEDNGCISTLVCGSHICRTGGYWSTHSGYAKAGTINVGQEVLDAVGGIDVCGQHVDSTTNPQAPWVQGLGLSSSLEGLCVDVRTVTRRQLYRQLVAAGLNCAISGGDCDDTLLNYIDVTFTECSELCETQTQAPGGPSVSRCINELDCFNNGGQIINGKCALGTCAQQPARYCGGGYGNCPKSGGQAQACVPFPNNCHSAALCNEALGVCPKNTPASSEKPCQEASKNNCTIDSCP